MWCVQGEAGEGDALTPQAAQELMDKCRQYCDDPDPLCLLNIGEHGSLTAEIWKHVCQKVTFKW